MENLQQKVTPTERNLEIGKIMEADRSGTVREYIAELVEMAYIAGVNQLDITGSGKHTENLITTGEALVKARNYVKDKGLRI